MILNKLMMSKILSGDPEEGGVQAQKVLEIRNF